MTLNVLQDHQNPGHVSNTFRVAVVLGANLKLFLFLYIWSLSQSRIHLSQFLNFSQLVFVQYLVWFLSCFGCIWIDQLLTTGRVWVPYHHGICTVYTAVLLSELVMLFRTQLTPFWSTLSIHRPKLTLCFLPKMICGSSRGNNWNELFLLKEKLEGRKHMREKGN